MCLSRCLCVFLSTFQLGDGGDGDGDGECDGDFGGAFVGDAASVSSRSAVRP